MSELFKLPLKLYTDSGTIRIENANGTTVIPEFLWNGERPHYERQLQVAQAVLAALNEVYGNPLEVRAGDLHAEHVVHNGKGYDRAKETSIRMKEYWRKRREARS